jgi:hypothetical protein
LRAGLDGPDEPADELAIDLLGDLLQIGALPRQKLLRICNRIHARDLDLSCFEAG